MALNQLKNIDDLLNLREHSENAIFNSIRARLKDGNPYTWAGPALISVNPGVPLLLNQDTRRQYDEKSCANMPPHLYSISSSAYKDLLKEEMSQVISLLGHSGSGKTFNLIQLLDHLVWLGSRDALSEQVDADKELFSLLHNGVQALHILGSVVRESNVEGTCCALVVDVSYDSEFRAVGGKIKAKLLDSSLPKPKNGRTYQILHSLLCASKPILQSLGITSNSNYKLLQSKMDSATKAQLRTIDAEIWHRFLECLNNLGIQRKETQSLLQILTAVILCFDLHFVPNSFVKAGQTQDIWEPRNRPVVQKLAKLLETTEGKFLECFGVFATKLEAENRMLDLARMLYKIGFEWLNERINEALALHTKTMVELRINSLSLNLPPAQLREIRQSIEPRHSVSIIDFPGYNDESSLGSFSTNLAIEALNYYCSQNYIKLVAALKSEQISIQHMEIPRCHNIVDLCMGKQGNGLISALSHSYQDFLGYWKLLKNCDAYEEILEIESKTKFNLNFTWGQVNYDISSLRKEAHEHFSQELNYIFIKKWSNPILVYMSGRYFPQKQGKLSQVKTNCVFGDKIYSTLANLLKPVIIQDPYLVFCLHTEREDKPITQDSLESVELPLNTTISLFRNTLIFPILLWEWYGFPQWIDIDEFLEKFGGNVSCNNRSDKLSYINQIISDNAIIGTNHVLLKDEEMANLSSRLEKIGESVNSRREVISGTNSPSKSSKLKRPRHRHSFTFDSNIQNILPEPTVEEFLQMDNVEVANVSFERYNLPDDTTRKDSAIISGGINISRRQNRKGTGKTISQIVVAPSKKQFTSMSKSVTSYENVDYSPVEPQITKIQSLARQFFAQRYVGVLRMLNGAAVTIQSHWKGLQARKYTQALLQIRDQVVTIQRAYRKFRGKKIRAAIKIQRSWREFIKRSPYLSSILTSMKSSPNRSQKYSYLLSINQRSTSSLKKSTVADDQYKYKPKISDYSRALANSKQRRTGAASIPFEQRFQEMEQERQKRLHTKRQNQLELENSKIQSTPQINKVKELPNTFYDRQMILMNKYQNRREEERSRLAEDEFKHHTFQPTVNKTKRVRTPDAIVRDLYKWAKIREKNLGNAKKEQEEKNQPQENTILGLTNRTRQIAAARKMKDLEAEREAQRQEAEAAPYWPRQIQELNIQMGERFEWHYNNRNQLYSDLPGTLSMKSVHSPTSTFGSWDNIMNRTDSNAKGRAHQSKLHTQQEKVSKRVLVPEHDPANLDSPRKTTSQLTKESTRQRKEHVACRPVTQGDRILYRNATSEANILNMKGNDGYAYKGKIVQQDTVLPDRRFKRHCDVADIQRQSQINTLPGGHRDTVERPPRQVQSPNKQSTSENNQRRQLKACASQPVFNAHKTTFEQMDVESLVNAPHALGLVTGLQKTYFGTSTRELNPHMKKKPRPANSMNFYSSTRPW